MYLFDTDILIDLLRNADGGRLRQRIENVPLHQRFISTISLSELVYGAWRSGRAKYHLEQIRDILLQHIQLVDFDADAAWHAGRLRATLAQDGTPLAASDLQIAAIAVSRKLTLVTANTKHFERVHRLILENWRDMHSGSDEN